MLCEEHNIVGGLGSAVRETLADAFPVPIVRVRINDAFGETGPHEALLDRLGLGVQGTFLRPSAGFSDGGEVN